LSWSFFMTGPFTGRAARDERGFTLIETILTLSILVVMLGIVFSAMRMGIRSWEKGEAVAEEASAARAVTSKLAKEAGSLYPYRDMVDGSEVVLFTGENTELGFVTVSQGLSGLPWGGGKWVYYSLRADVLTVREKTVPSAGVLKDEGGRLTELDSGVDRVSFEYMGAGGWENIWNADDKQALPASIRVNISFRDGRKPIMEQVNVGLTGDMRKDQITESLVK